MVKTKVISEVKKKIIKLSLGTGLLTIQYLKVSTFQTIHSLLSFCFPVEQHSNFRPTMLDLRTLPGVNSLLICVLLILFKGKPIDTSEGGRRDFSIFFYLYINIFIS